MRIAARAAHAVAGDAELLSCTRVAKPAQTDGSVHAAAPWSLRPPRGESHPGGCGLAPPELTSTPLWAWQLSQKSPVLWQVVQSPGWVRASSEWRETYPARWTPSRSGSSNAIFSGNAGVVRPWQPAQNLSA